MSIVAFDTETRLTGPGEQFPRAACVAVDAGRGPAIRHARDPLLPSLLAALLAGHVVGANTAFDAGVLCRNWPSLVPAVFDAYESDRVECVQVRQKLIDIGTGQYRGFRHQRGKLTKIGYALDNLAERHTPLTLDKANPWRLRFGDLIDAPIEHWPREAVAYACDDATATYHVRQAQEPFAALLGDQYRQARYDFALKLTSAAGVRTDPAAVPHFGAAISERLGLLAERLRGAEVGYMTARGPACGGLINADGSRNTKAAAARMALWLSLIHI